MESTDRVMYGLQELVLTVAREYGDKAWIGTAHGLGTRAFVECHQPPEIKISVACRVQEDGRMAYEPDGLDIKVPMSGVERMAEMAHRMVTQSSGRQPELEARLVPPNVPRRQSDRG